jgi:hypothetical protein
VPCSPAVFWGDMMDLGVFCLVFMAWSEFEAMLSDQIISGSKSRVRPAVTDLYVLMWLERAVHRMPGCGPFWVRILVIERHAPLFNI